MAARCIRSPTLLIHSRSDDYTPSSHSEAIFAGADPQVVGLELTGRGSGHTRDYRELPERYRALVRSVLARRAPDSGEAAP